MSAIQAEEQKRSKKDGTRNSEAVESTRKKEKRKNKSNGESTIEAVVVADDVKKDKKKKRKLEPEANGEVVAMHIIQPETEQGAKKKKKRKLEVEAEAQDAAMEVDPQPEVEEPEKKKKRKRDGEEVQMRPTAAAASISSSKKDKKKNRKADSSTETLSAHAPTGSSTPAQSEIDAFLTKHSITIHTPPSQTTPSPTPIISFAQLTANVVPAELSSAFKGFKEPTPVQACTWPPALQGQDVVGIAETGSGKTLAFGIPALARLLTSPPSDGSDGKAKGKASTVTVLVVAPTRELALQTHDTLSALGAPFGIASVAIFGGVDKGPQIRSLSNANKDGKVTRIVVGTPGRILDLVNDGACDLSGVNYLVLDEADRMLDKGFENDIRNIISFTRPQSERQTMMFSATWPEAVRRLASTFQTDPVRVTVGSDDLTANSRVEQSVEVFDDSRSKDSRLLDRLRQLSHKKTTKTGSEEARILVFALYKKEASRVEEMLRRQGYAVGALHGDMSQSARMEALEKFKDGTTGLLVATDVAARGLDIPNVGAVINYTFPLTIEDYIHRIGRTGRGGRSGKSITFFTGDAHERSLAGELARVLRDSGFDSAAESLGAKFPMTIKKKTHSAYGAFFRDDIPAPKGPTKIVF